MSNIKLHPSTVWTLRTKKKLLEKIKNRSIGLRTWKLLLWKKKLLEKIKKWRRRTRELKNKKYSQSEHNCLSIQKKGNTIADCLHIFNEKTEYGPLYVCTVCLQTCLNLQCMTLANYFSEHR